MKRSLHLGNSASTPIRTSIPLSAIALVALVALVASCASETPRRDRRIRDFDPGRYAMTSTNATSHGSLAAGGRFSLFEDIRPSDVGDVIVIRVDEADSASHDARTKLDHKSDRQYGLSGAIEKLDPDLDMNNLFGATNKYDFEGGGRIQRKGQVSAMLPVRVQTVLPNGDFYVEGTKIVVIGEEERHLYVSGIVRPTDVRSDGSVSSSRLADAEIEYVGDGDITRQQKEGWLSSILSYLWPF